MGKSGDIQGLFGILSFSLAENQSMLQPSPSLFSHSSGWVAQCLEETQWTSWQPLNMLGEGTHSLAILVGRSNRKAVLVMDRPNKPPPGPGFPSSIEAFRSCTLIRRECKRLGIRVPLTVGAPREWSGGAAVLMSLIRGEDHGKAIQNRSVDARSIGRQVARIVEQSWGLGDASPEHSVGFGRHLFGRIAPALSGAEAYRLWGAPLRGKDSEVDNLMDGLQDLADRWLPWAPRTTQVWDMGDRNVMVEGSDRVVGLVDQADMFSGDPMFVPGFCTAMLGDIHSWNQVDDYLEGWVAQWGADEQDRDRIILHRLASHGRIAGKAWGLDGQRPASMDQWVARAKGLLSRHR